MSDRSVHDNNAYACSILCRGRPPMLEVRELTTDGEIADAFPLMPDLRPHLSPLGADGFITTVRLQQQDGYRLYGGFAPSPGNAGSRLVALAGVRDARTLSRGPHLFVDDLVTAPAERGKGHGTALLRWLAAHAAARGFSRVYLDSRDTALGFYRQIGFQTHTSVPCWIDVEQLLARPHPEPPG